jgi:hypothetical protein
MQKPSNFGKVVLIWVIKAKCGSLYDLKVCPSHFINVENHYKNILEAKQRENRQSPFVHNNLEFKEENSKTTPPDSSRQALVKAGLYLASL